MRASFVHADEVVATVYSAESLMESLGFSAVLLRESRNPGSGFKLRVVKTFDKILYMLVSIPRCGVPKSVIPVVKYQMDANFPLPLRACTSPCKKP